jgi:transposase-like protein
MIGGKQHVLVEHEASETTAYNGIPYTYHWKYRCSECGQKFQKRNPSPSCTIDFIEQVDALAKRLSLDAMWPDPCALVASTTAMSALDVAVKKTLHWKKFLRERFIRDWRSWREFKKEGQVGTT